MVTRERFRTGPAPQRRFDIGKGKVGPYAGKIRDRRGAPRAAAGWLDHGRHRLPEGDRQRSCRCRQCRQQKEPLSLTAHARLPLRRSYFDEIVRSLRLDPKFLDDRPPFSI
jgi:hypothetical protein